MTLFYDGFSIHNQIQKYLSRNSRFDEKIEYPQNVLSITDVFYDVVIFKDSEVSHTRNLGPMKNRIPLKIIFSMPDAIL